MWKNLIAAASTTAILGATPIAWAWPGFRYEVTITNITPAQSFTPQLVVTHPEGVSLFELGLPASEPLEILAEGGATDPLMTALAPVATEMTTIDGLLGPGETASVEINGRPRDLLSIAAMLIPTNDTFVALNGMTLPRYGDAETLLLAYDSGTEANDQDCANIPGPRCGGEGHSPGPNDGDEGFVHISAGFHTLPDAEGAEILGPVYDWRNPVARITVKRTR